MVHSFVVAAQDHQVLLDGQLVGHGLRKGLSVGRSEDDLVVVTLRLEFFHQLEDGFDHHHHAGVAAETVVVDLTPASFAIFADVVDKDFHEPLVTGPFHDRIAKRTLEQLRNDGQNIDSHTQVAKLMNISKKRLYLQVTI